MGPVLLVACLNHPVYGFGCHWATVHTVCILVVPAGRPCLTAALRVPAAQTVEDVLNLVPLHAVVPRVARSRKGQRAAGRTVRAVIVSNVFGARGSPW